MHLAIIIMPHYVYSLKRDLQSFHRSLWQLRMNHGDFQVLFGNLILHQALLPISLGKRDNHAPLTQQKIRMFWVRNHVSQQGTFTKMDDIRNYVTSQLEKWRC